MALQIFFPSISGMDAQSHAMQTVSMNIANMRTVGYKSAETMFYTMLGSEPVAKGNAATGLPSSRVDIHGVGYYDRTGVTHQGVVSATGNYYDVAINGTGNGFFVLKNQAGEVYYTRAGDFNTRSENGIPHLVSNGGLYLQGFKANASGGFDSTLSNVAIDYPNTVPSTPTTRMEIVANVPATGVDTSSYGLQIYGPNNDGRAATMLFTKAVSPVDSWDVTFSIQDGTVTGGPFQVRFDTDGTLISPEHLNIGVTWNDGSSNPAIDIDISNMTQYTGGSGIDFMDQDGHPSGTFMYGYIDNDGVVKAKYSNGDTKDYAKLALVSFTAPENLTPVSNTMFAYNTMVGDSHYLLGPDTGLKDILSAQSVELSTSNVEKDFANMVLIQRAYSLNAKSFTTANEMTEVAVNLKT